MARRNGRPLRYKHHLPLDYRGIVAKANRLQADFLDVKEFLAIIKDGCHWCGDKNETIVERINAGLHGAWTADNVRPACKMCVKLREAVGGAAFSRHLLRLKKRLDDGSLVLTPADLKLAEDHKSLPGYGFSEGFARVVIPDDYFEETKTLLHGFSVKDPLRIESSSKDSSKSRKSASSASFSSFSGRAGLGYRTEEFSEILFLES